MEIVILRVIVLLMSLAASSAQSAAPGPGTTGAEFLRIPAGARPAALGDAFSGFADDVHALFYNPGGLGFLRRQEVGLVHDAYAPGVNHEWVGYVVPTDNGTFGLAANMLFIAPFDSFDQFDQPAGRTSASDAAYQFSYAARLSEHVALGASGKYISSRLAQYSASTIAGDVGVLYRPWKQLRLGVSYLDFGKGVSYISDASPLPTALRAGFAFAPIDPAEYSQTLVLAFEYLKPRGEASQIGGGLEFWHYNVLALRIGGRSGQDAGTGLTLGIGVWINRGRRDVPEIGFDYAFVNSGELAQTHRGEVSVRFGTLSPDAERGMLDRGDGLYRGPSGRRSIAVPPEPKPQRPNLDERHMDSNYIDWVSP